MSAGSDTSERQAIRVVMRVRPASEAEKGSDEVVQVLNDSRCVVRSADRVNTFDFDRVFGQQATQSQIYDACIRPTVEAVLSGHNGTVLAYGQTGSGKTHTMMGTRSGELQGAIPRMVEQVFSAKIKARFTVAFLEIYNDKIKDLLKPEHDDLRLGDQISGGAYVKGLTELNVTCANDVYEAMQRGNVHRSVGVTSMNARSSRSHSIFDLEIYRADGLRGRLFLVDLAGSEKAAKTGARDKQLEEASNINLSLSALGNVIKALEAKSSHVPYRDSKLTRILQDSLGGSAKTSLIITCSPASLHQNETLSSLRFGSRASKLTTNPRLNANGFDFVTSAVRELSLWRAGARVPQEQWVDIQALRSSRAVVVTNPEEAFVSQPADVGSENVVDSLRRQLAERDLRLSSMRDEYSQLSHNAESLNQENNELKRLNRKLQHIRTLDRYMLQRRAEEIANLSEQLAARQEQAGEDEMKVYAVASTLRPRVNILKDEI